MKTNALLAIVAAGALALTSCSQKIDEKTISEITTFGTEWTALGERATAWSTDLTSTAQQARDFATKTHAITESMATTKDETMKTKAAEMSKMADQDAATLEAMTTEWTSFKTTWDENTTAFTEWSAKVTKGEVSPADATKGLADWRTKMTDAQTQIETWTTTLAAAKENTTKNMAMATELEQSATTTTK